MLSSSRQSLCVGVLTVFAQVGTITWSVSADEPGRYDTARLRYPVALALADAGKLLLTANQRSGSISLIDLKTRKLVGEVEIGERLSDLVAIPESEDECFLATDEGTNQIHLLRRVGSQRTGAELSIVNTIRVSPHPVSVCVDEEGRRGLVVSMWARQLTIVDIIRESQRIVEVRAVGVIALPFAPRLQILTPCGEAALVADSFGGQLALVDLKNKNLKAVRAIPAQNIRGLAWSPDGKRLLISHQILNRSAETTEEDIHWGSLLENAVLSLQAANLQSTTGVILADSHQHLLGEFGSGAGDPAEIAVTKDGTIYVALAGVGQVAINSNGTVGFRRLSVGVRPTALLVNPIRGEVYVADTFGDSIAVILGAKMTSISLGVQSELTSVDRGERLFFDARLSHDGWMSCHSCHTDGHTNGSFSDTLGDGSFGTPKRIPAMGGVGATGPWGWDGATLQLTEQVRKSAHGTMHAKFISENQIQDLADYLRSLEPAVPVISMPNAMERLAINRGKLVFTELGCIRCHAPPTYTAAAVFDVGFKDELGNTFFNPPSLRGVSQRSPLFHDGRAESLEEVLDVFEHQLDRELFEGELTDLLQFLRSL